jgi:hypothetical protein
VFGKPREDRRNQRLSIHVAAGVAVGHEVERGLIVVFRDESAVETGLDRSPRAVRQGIKVPATKTGEAGWLQNADYPNLVAGTF